MRCVSSSLNGPWSAEGSAGHEQRRPMQLMTDACAADEAGMSMDAALLESH